MKEQTLFKQGALFMEMLITLHKNASKGSYREGRKYCLGGDFDNRQMEQTPRKCFRCGSQDHLVSKCMKPPKENEKQIKQEGSNEKGNRASDNSKNTSDQNIYAYMSHMSGNDECPSGTFGDSYQLTNCILDSRATCHMAPEVSDFILGSLEDTD